MDVSSFCSELAGSCRELTRQVRKRIRRQNYQASYSQERTEQFARCAQGPISQIQFIVSEKSC
jgi:hypothetical protein